MLKFLDRKNLDSKVDLIEICPRIFALQYEFESPFKLLRGTKIWVRRKDCFLVYELTVDLPNHTQEELEHSISCISDFLRNK